MDVPIEIVPAIISIIENNYLYDTTLQIVGWGKSNESRVMPILKKTRVQVLSNDECIRRLSFLVGCNVLLYGNQVLCTAADPYVITTGVSIYYIIRLFVLKEIY
jgi:hypothetical protein